MRRPALAIALVLIALGTPLAPAHGPDPLGFDPVGNGNRRLSNPYGYGFRGATGQGAISGLFRPYVIDGPGLWRSDSSREFPFRRRGHLGNARQAGYLLLHRLP